MPLRDSQGRFCGTLNRKEVDGHWDRCYFVLDEEKCLLRYFSHINAQVSKEYALICLQAALVVQSSRSRQPNYHILKFMLLPSSW